MAGYPSTSSTLQTAYKPALAYADLTQIGLPSSQVDMLVAWRNYASTQAPGSFTDPGFTALSASNYYQYVISNTTGFLVPNTAVYNGQTDQQFTSRQQLINFFESGLGLTGTGLDVLNYLATFTRALDQPSIVPDPTRPVIQHSASNGGNTAQGLDNQINPVFPTVLVTGSFTRNDGTTAVIGQPLVNKRFALNRLAWLTYLGPSANRVIPTSNPGITSPNYDMWQLVNTYGFSPAYLQQGTAANIQKYFGLVWQVDTVPIGSGVAASFHDGEYKWFYQGHLEQGQNASGTSSTGVTTSNASGAITRLEDLPLAPANELREPDFFELLKAAVAAGSKAKGAMNLAEVESHGGSTLHPYYYQTSRDTSLDYAIIQLGANIIDQFKVDGYATRIVFQDSSADVAREFRGVENLPYLYRLQSATLKLRMENPILPSADQEEDSPQAGPLKDTGVAMIMHIPTIWNPHDENAPLGDPAPAGPGVFPTLVSGSSTNFRLIADSTDPDDLASSTNTSPSTTVYTGFFGSGSGSIYNETTAGSNATYLGIAKRTYTTGPNGTGASITPYINLAQPPAPNVLDPSESALNFVVPNTTLFREPTVLARPNYPAGSELQMAAPSGITQYNLIENENGQLVYSATAGVLSDSPNPLDLPTAPPATQGYIGICAALYPVEWPGAPESSGTLGIYHSAFVTLDYYNGDSGGPNLTYRLQYLDPNPQDPPNSWVTYDEKYTQLATPFLSTAFGTVSGNLSDQADEAQGGDWQSYADPRTSRFAAVNGRDLESPVQTPGGSDESQEWADPANDVSVTDRPDYNSGYAISDNRPPVSEFAEFYALAANGWTLSSITDGHFRIGLLSQNTASVQDNGIRFKGDAAEFSTSGEGPTYYADPDGVARGAMGNYVTGGASAPASTTVGLPLATAYPAAYTSGTGAYQGQSRPYILHRPFRSVAELGYVFSGTPWKNLDLFTPQSGDAPLLDVFTINEPPSETTDPNELIAGAVNLNTRQEPVLQAILAGASVDEAQTSGTANTGFTPLTGAQADAILTTTAGTNFLARTSGTTTGVGPLRNVSELVGTWVEANGGYSGPSADLEGIYSYVFGGSTVGLTMQNVDRFQESFIRPLATVGNTRVWNLMIDIVAQTGQYPSTASTLDNFNVCSQKRYWLHEAIDRYTGQVLDQDLEPVGPTTLSLSGTSVTDDLPTGTPVATLGSSELLAGATFTYTLPIGSGSNDNTSFTISGNTLQTAAVFDYLAKSAYNIVLRVTDQNGFTYDQPVTVAIQPGPYTQWKIANFGSSAGNPAVAGDLVDAENDGLPNLLKYALGKSPSTPSTTGITFQSNGGLLVMNYTQASAATDVTVTASCTTDFTNPASWTTSGVTQTMLSDNGTIQQWQATVPRNSSPALFLHLTVSRP